MPDREMNERYRRDQTQLARLGGYLGCLMIPAWFGSYYASNEMLWVNHGYWWQAACAFMLIAALGTTIGAGVVFGIRLTNLPPLPGSNY